MYHFSYFAEYILYGSVVLFNGLWIFGFLFVLVQVISVLFFFRQNLLRSMNNARPNLPFWAHKLKMWICMNRSHFLHPFFENDSKWIMIEVDLIALVWFETMWYNKVLSKCQIWLVDIQYKCIKFRSEKRVKPMGYNLKLRVQIIWLTQIHATK